MDYNHITAFFDKFKKILTEGDVVRSAIAEVVSKHISITITTTEIKTKGTIIYISGSPVLRNEILLRKEAILTELLLLIPGSRFTDIR
jgi:hypothetical protein